MIENRQRDMRLALPIRLHQQIAAPHSIAWDGAWNTMFQLPPRCEDKILMASARVRDVGLTHRHLSVYRPPPIEVVGNRPAAHLRHQGFEPNHFVLNPFWFRLGENQTGWYRPLTTPSVWCAACRSPTTQDLPYPGEEHNKPSTEKVCHRIPL